MLRAELRGTGVRATLVSPGPVDTTLWDAVDPGDRAGLHAARTTCSPPTRLPTRCCYVVTAPAAVNVDELRLSRS